MTKKATIETGASTLEFIIVLSAVVSVLIVFFSHPGGFKTALNRTLITTSNEMASMAASLESSRGPTLGPSSLGSPASGL